jgi:malate dehydrogenase
LETIAILGAGELGATLARRLAARELCRRVVLVDSDEGRARGKALDILQSGPVEGFDTRVEGCADRSGVAKADVWVVADPPELDAAPFEAARADALVGTLGPAVLVAAGRHDHALVEAAVRCGVSRGCALGSAPQAFAGALRHRLALELDAAPGAMAVAVLGYLPEHVVVPYGSATLGGVPVERLSATALGRALHAARGRGTGPLARAAAAERVLEALASPRASVLSVVARLDGEYGHRGVALAVPARLARGRLDGILEFSLEPVDRVALDTAAQRRQESGP